MSGKFRRTAAFIAASAAILFFFAKNTHADGYRKEETVYAKLASDGALKNVFVVNSFELNDRQTVTDYGLYEKIVNLTDTKPLKSEGGKITLTAGSGRFYYQGDLEHAELPWLIGVSYLLDGKETAAKETAGKSGQLRIRIRIAKNPEADPVFYKNYSLQTTLSLPSDSCFDIAAEDGVIANAGGNKTVTFTLLPDSEAEYIIDTTVSDFSMDGIQFGAVPLSASFDLPVSGDMTERFRELTDGVAKLDDGAKTLADGSNDLRYGMRKLRNGAGELKNGADALLAGITELDSGTAELFAGSIELEDGALALANGLSRLTESGNELNDGAEQIFSGFIDLVNEQLKGYKDLFSAMGMELPMLTPDNYASVLTELLDLIGGAASQRVFEEVRQQITEEAVIASEKELIHTLLSQRGLSGYELDQAVNAAMENESEKAALLEQAEALLVMRTAQNYVLSRDPSLTGDALAQAVAAALRDPDIQSFLIGETVREQQAAIDEAAERMMADPAVQKQISDALPPVLRSNEQYQALLQLKFQLDGIAAFCGGVFAFTDGVAQAARGTGKLYYGLNEVKDGIGDLHEGTSELCSGALEFAQGAGSFYTGAQDLYAGMKRFDEGLTEYTGGTGEFNEQISSLNIDKEISTLLKSVNGSEFRPVSFTDQRNNVTRVQFVMMTESVETGSEPAPVDEPEKEQTFWSRLLALFGL